MRITSFLAGAAVGYVLGARAGQERYKEIVDGVRKLGERPEVQQAQARVTDLLNRGKGATNGQPSAATYGSPESAPVPGRPMTS